jgi:hypothetical protein
VRHRRIDVVPRPLIRAPHKPDPVIVAEEDDVALAVATKYHPLIGAMPRFLLREFSAAFGECRPASLRDRERLSRPSPFGDARVVALDDVSCVSELVQLAVLTTAGRHGDHQKCSAVLLDALQHREKRRSEFQFTHRPILDRPVYSLLKYMCYDSDSSILGSVKFRYTLNAR